MEKDDRDFLAIIGVGVAVIGLGIGGIAITISGDRHLDNQITALDTKFDGKFTGLSGQVAENKVAISSLKGGLKTFIEEVLEDSIKLVSPGNAEPAPKE